MASGPRETIAGDRPSALMVDLPRAEPGTTAKDPAPELAPPFPSPLERKLGLLKLLRVLWRNPLEAWTRAHFEEMIVLDRSIFGEIAIVNDPEAIRRVLSDNAENYRKGALQHRVLGPGLRNGLLLSEDRQWRDQRRVLAPSLSQRTVTDFAPAMRAAIGDMVARWKVLGDGAVVDMAAEMAALTLDVLTRTIFPDGSGAGQETTANALTWSTYLPSQSDEWRSLVLEEARDAAAGASELVRTRAVMEEALRLYPPLVAISREAAEADELAGARIGKGAMVVIAPYLLHRHRQLWERPDVFDPSRFLPEARAGVPRYSYLPFGVGPRICIGAAFALQEATLALAAIVRDFRLDLLPGHKVLPLQRVTLRPAGGLPVRLSARRQ